MSMLSFINLSYPGHVILFFTNLISTSKFDVLQSESYHHELFDFATTEPLNLKFLQFGVKTKTFLLNSGPVVGLIVLILSLKFTFLCLNSVAVHNHQMPFWRRVGIWTYKTTTTKQLKTMMIEGYLLICWAGVLNVIEWVHNDNNL